MAIPFVVVSLLPGALPRYTMPLLAPAIWLLAIFIREHALLWPKPLRKAITWTVVVVTAAMLIYSLAIIPLLQRREKVRPIAAQLEAALPPNESLYAVDPDYQPFLFYLHRPIVYVSEVKDLPRCRALSSGPTLGRKESRRFDALGAGTGRADSPDQGLPGPPGHPPAGERQSAGNALTRGRKRIR